MTTPTIQQVNATAVAVLSTDANSLGSGSSVTTSVNGSSGVFTPAAFSNYPFGLAELVCAAGSNFTANTTVYGWWMNSVDGGSNYESQAQAQLRPPDMCWIVNAATSFRQCVYCVLPLGYAKACFQNNTGQAWSASGNTVKILLGTTQIPSL
jgi:hypothetical protein